MIVVSMTSWTKRIQYVKRVVESIMNNTIKPDRVYLNLSKTEFEGIELPKDLVEYFNSDKRLIINWVEGENTKSMKKIFPVLKYLKDDDIIISADDDILFPVDLIESRINDFNGSGKQYSISSNTNNSIGFDGKMKVVSAMSLFQKKMFNKWEKYVDNTIIHTYNDDRTYLYMLWLNGFYNKACTKNSVSYLLENYEIRLDDTSMTKNSVHAVGRKYDRIAEEKLNIKCDKDIQKMFGYFK